MDPASPEEIHTWSSLVTIIASTPGSFSTSVLPSSKPKTNTAVDKASALAALFCHNCYTANPTQENLSRIKDMMPALAVLNEIALIVTRRDNTVVLQRNYPAYLRWIIWILYTDTPRSPIGEIQ